MSASTPFVDNPVLVVGAGLAGSEAAWQLARRGIPVMLIEMRPGEYTPAHKTDGFAELVCSNSLRAARVENAVGLLKEEMRRLDSLVLRAADATSVPAGGALAVDRALFSEHITSALQSHPFVRVCHARVDTLPQGDCIIATGPLTSDALAEEIFRLLGGKSLSFYDAAAPIVAGDSIDFSRVYPASRYGKGTDDYLNCPMSEAEYFAFVQALVSAECAPVHGFEDARVFEGCMPVETMAKRGAMTLAYGPLKPIGLRDPRTGKTPFAVVQLRKENAAGTMYNIVGFQTRLKHDAQKRVFRMIPGLENARFARLGVMHRNTYIASPGLLTREYACKAREGLYFAGQMTGVEGYVESAASGLLAALSMAARRRGAQLPDFTARTAIGALGYYVSQWAGRDFQPMNVCFGIIDPLDARVRDKQDKNRAIAARSLAYLDSIIPQLPGAEETEA